jgi:pimeloyl-ACP methyl ester carboxylesterase
VERLDLDAAADAMERAAAARPLRPLPLVVLSAGHTGEMTPEEAAALPPGYAAALQAAIRAGWAFNAGLRPDARHIVVTESGHYIQAEHPALVIDAIRQVVAAVRRAPPGVRGLPRTGTGPLVENGYDGSEPR